MHAFKSTGSANTPPFSPFTEANSDSLRLSFLDYVLYHPHRWWRIWPIVSRDSLPGQSRLPWAAGFCELSLGEEYRSISWLEIHKASSETGKQAQCETDSCNRWLIHCLFSRHCVFVHVGGVSFGFSSSTCVHYSVPSGFLSILPFCFLRPDPDNKLPRGIAEKKYKWHFKCSSVRL